MSEEWKSVVGWEGFYEVSSLGRVRRTAFTQGTKPSRKFLKNLIGTNGRQYVGLRKGGKKHRVTVYSLVAKAFIGPVPDGKEINHIDGCCTNDQLTNLEYVTKSENLKHSYKNGHTRMRGELCGKAKLNANQVLEIRKMRSLGFLFKDIAASFGISKVHASCICRGKNWSHL